jgi:hypothetical protein
MTDMTMTDMMVTVGMSVTVTDNCDGNVSPGPFVTKRARLRSSTTYILAGMSGSGQSRNWRHLCRSLLLYGTTQIHPLEIGRA